MSLIFDQIMQKTVNMFMSMKDNPYPQVWLYLDPWDGESESRNLSSSR